MDVPKGEAVDEKILIPLGIAGVGWGIMILGYFYHQGRRDERMLAKIEMANQKIATADKRIDRDEKTFLKAIDELKDTFVDRDGNSRLMPVINCSANRDGCEEKFATMKKTFEKFEEKGDKNYSEMFTRIRTIEKSVIHISSFLEVHKKLSKPLTERKQPLLGDDE